MAGELWISALAYDRTVDASGAYGTTITSTGEAWAAPADLVESALFDQSGANNADGDNSPVENNTGTGSIFETFGTCVWFGQIIVVPATLALGNILTTQVQTVELFNSTDASISYDAFVNNTDSGITITNQPMLPATIGPFNSIVLNVQVTPVGPPTISGTLDFTLETSILRQVTVTGSRVTVFAARPSNPQIMERLEWFTDIMEAYDGTEQRIRVRDYPRQILQAKYFEEDDEAANLRALLFDWLPRVWGVPTWFEERALGADAPASSTTVTVDTTNADFRVGGIAILYEDQFNFEALEIDSLTASSITFTSPTDREHLAKNTSVMPLRTAYANVNNAREQHMLQGQQRLELVFTVIDNTDLSDASAFPTYQGQVLLDEPNLVRGAAITEGWTVPVQRFDPVAGNLLQEGERDRAKISSVKTFYAAGAARLWQVRQLLHALQGGVQPFWLPSFRPDMRVVTDIGASAGSFTIRNIGFTDFVAQRLPWKHLRLVLNDGTTFIREITASSVIDTDTESISIDTAFSGSPITVAEIKRVELLALVRMKKDSVTLEHTHPGYASVSMEVVTVQVDP